MGNIEGIVFLIFEQWDQVSDNNISKGKTIRNVNLGTLQWKRIVKMFFLDVTGHVRPVGVHL